MTPKILLMGTIAAISGSTPTYPLSTITTPCSGTGAGGFVASAGYDATRRRKIVFGNAFADNTNVHSPGTSRVSGNVFEVIDMIKDTDVAREAARTIRSVIDCAALHGNVNFPPMAATQDADGVMSVEWIFSQSRIGLVFDSDPAHSGWYIVSTNDAENIYSVGGMDTLDVSHLVDAALRAAR